MKVVFTLAIIFLGFIADLNAQQLQWRPVSGERHKNISGMALIEHNNNQTSFLVVHDNKKKEQIHAGIVTVTGNNAPQYTPLEWLGNDIPVDLEAVTSVPNSPNNFMAFTSSGRVFHIKINRIAKTVEVIKSFDVPEIPAESDFEGFALQKIGSQLLAVWADRGLDAKPARVFWGNFNLQNHTFSEVGSTTFKVPYPIGNTRHISDVKVDETGAVFVSSASDPGNDGPFSSAIYYAGLFKTGSNQSIAFIQPTALTRLYHFDYHKVEAIELVSGADGGFAFGTDDENLGAAIYLDW